MRRFPTTAVIVILAFIFGLAGWQLFAHREADRFRSVDAVRTSASVVRLALHVRYASGPIATEDYTLVDVDGRSQAVYAVGNRKGTVATFTEDIRGYDVSFAFGKMVQDGIWEIDSKHRRAFDETAYTIAVEQTAQSQSGRRTVTFTNPHYWATAAGRQYRIRLDPNKPTPTQADLLRLDSTSIADPRYERIVNDFVTFGSPRFKKTVASARAKVLKS